MLETLPAPQPCLRPPLLPTWASASGACLSPGFPAGGRSPGCSRLCPSPSPGPGVELATQSVTLGATGSPLVSSSVFLAPRAPGFGTSTFQPSLRTELNIDPLCGQVGDRKSQECFRLTVSRVGSSQKKEVVNAWSPTPQAASTCLGLLRGTPSCSFRLPGIRGVTSFVLLISLGSKQDASTDTNAHGVVLGTGCCKPVWRCLALSSEAHQDMLLIMLSFVGDFLLEVAQCCLFLLAFTPICLRGEDLPVGTWPGLHQQVSLFALAAWKL